MAGVIPGVVKCAKAGIMVGATVEAIADAGVVDIVDAQVDGRLDKFS